MKFLVLNYLIIFFGLNTFAKGLSNYKDEIAVYGTIEQHEGHFLVQTNEIVYSVSKIEFLKKIL